MGNTLVWHRHGRCERPDPRALLLLATDTYVLNRTCLMGCACLLTSTLSLRWRTLSAGADTMRGVTALMPLPSRSL